MGHNADILETTARQQEVYEQAVHLMDLGLLMVKPAGRRDSFSRAAELFGQAGSYEDSASLRERCLSLAKEAQLQEVRSALDSIGRRLEENSFKEEEKLIPKLEELAGQGDASCEKQAKELLKVCRERSGRRRRKQTVRRALSLIIAAGLAFAVIWILQSGYFNFLKGHVYRAAGMESYALASYAKLGSGFGADQAYLSCELEALRRADAGGTVNFGGLKWRVLEESGSDRTVLLIASDLGADDALSGVAFDGGEAGKEELSWKDSGLRAWLNKEFLEETFTDAERSLIEAFERPASENPEYTTAFAEPTVDFLAPPSAQEMEAYADLAGTAGDCWLRTPGCDPGTAAFITSENEVRAFGMPAGTLLHVRPVIRVNLA